MPVKPVPDGYHTVTPYLTIRGVDKLIEFLKQVFGAQRTEYMTRPDGSVTHAEVRIGDSVVMMGEPTNVSEQMPGMLYLYIPDLDAAYKRALAAGATSVHEPTNEFYGDRSAAVKDASGNTWFMATHVEDVPREELEKRAKAARG